MKVGSIGDLSLNSQSLSLPLGQWVAENYARLQKSAQQINASAWSCREVMKFSAEVWHTCVSLQSVLMSELICHPPHPSFKIVFCVSTLVWSSGSVTFCNGTEQAPYD